MASTAHHTESATTAEALAVLRGHKADRDEAEVAMAKATIEWAMLNEVEPDDWYANYGQAYGDRGLPLAGAGAPLVSEFQAMEYAAALGMSTDAGKSYIGRILELRYRLPKLWARVCDGKLPVGRAGRIADQTMALPMAGAAYADQHLSPVAHSCSWAQVERLVTEALVRFDPEAAEAKRREAAESRHCDVHLEQVSYDGTVRIDGELDLDDALAFEEAIRTGAKQQAALGATEPLDVRRARAVGELARRQFAFDFDTEEESIDGRRGVVLFVHLTEDALKGAECVGRCQNTRSPISVEQIREWCGNPNANVTVKPVVDLADHIHVEAYEAPDRLKEQNALVDVHCVFPHCTKPAQRCDCDHVVARTDGGTTCSCNTAPLCRRHHRAKTHSAWNYAVLDRGTYLWTSPNGIKLIRDHHGTSSFPGEP
ncbi:MAG: HNH endonuclease [Actinomycetota bacterium]|nr:HNH endonuclease [Actinomycetota bacterium]